MDPIRQLLPILVLAVHALILLWLRRRSPAANATFESGRMIFRPIAESRFLVVLFLATFSAAVIGSSLLLRRPSQWWVPYMFIGFLFMVPFLYPPVLTIEVDGVTSRTWYGREKKIRREDVASLNYHLGKKHFTVRAADSLRSFTAHSMPGRTCSSPKSANIPACQCESLTRGAPGLPTFLMRKSGPSWNRHLLVILRFPNYWLNIHYRCPINRLNRTDMQAA